MENCLLHDSCIVFCHDAHRIGSGIFLWDKLDEQIISTVSTLEDDTADDPSVISYPTS